MDLLIVLTYVACAWSIFKIFKIPVNKWTVPVSYTHLDVYKIQHKNTPSYVCYRAG